VGQRCDGPPQGKLAQCTLVGGSLSFFLCVWENIEKIFFWEGGVIAADGPEGAELTVHFLGDCTVNVYIMWR